MDYKEYLEKKLAIEERAKMKLECALDCLWHEYSNPSLQDCYPPVEECYQPEEWR